MKTPVVFRKFKDGDVIALFPYEIADLKNNIMSYQHVGQHGAACPSLVIDLEVPSKSEVLPLFKELISIGYELEDLTYGMEK